MANENETVKQIAEEMQNDWAMLYFSEGTKKKNGEYSDVSVIEPEKVAERILAAHNREIAAKDEEIVKLRALVNGLADALDRRVCRIKDCRTMCGAGMGACMDIDHRELVDKAREVVK